MTFIPRTNDWKNKKNEKNYLIYKDSFTRLKSVLCKMESFDCLDFISFLVFDNLERI